MVRTLLWMSPLRALTPHLKTHSLGSHVRACQQRGLELTEHVPWLAPLCYAALTPMTSIPQNPGQARPRPVGLPQGAGGKNAHQILSPSYPQGPQCLGLQLLELCRISKNAS